jgi:hypothetical protein
MNLSERNARLVDNLRADFQARYEPNFAWKSACSQFLALPGLRGFWPMSSIDESGNTYDLSNQGRTLTYNGNPTYNYAGLAPYIDFDGTGDFLSRADEAGLDITGTETYVASAVRGLTLGGWFQANQAGATDGLLSKWDTGANQRSYLVVHNATNNLEFNISTAGTAVSATAISTGTMSVNAWFFSVARFVPSTSVAVYLNNVKTSSATAIASIFSSSASINIGAVNAANLLTGRASLCFLCAAALSDAIIGQLYQQSRALMGV